MKNIIKLEPTEFRQFIEKNNPQTWGEVSTEIGDNLRKYMLRHEQNFQCAYTEIRIENDSTVSHIDHFHKQSMFPKKRFLWNNLLTSCNSEFYGAKFKDKRITESDYKYLINPVLSNPATHLEYAITGEILSKDEYGKTTIELFNLNDKSLVEQRSTIAKQIKLMCNDFEVDELINQYMKFETFIRFVYNFYKAVDNQY